MKKFAIAALALAFVALPASAATVVLNAQGEGWCQSGSGCNSSDTNISNTFASEAQGFRDFFSFTLPVGETVTAATLSIWSEAPNTAYNGGTYNLYQSTDLSFDGLLGSTVLGSIDAAVADNGTSHYVAIELNQAGLDALTGAGGNLFRFGGVTTPAFDEMFGYGGGAPAAFLTLTTSAAAVPEPASWAMMVGGFGLMGAAMRRKKAAVSFA